MRRLIIGGLIIAILVGMGTSAWGISGRVAGSSQDTPSPFSVHDLEFAPISENIPEERPVPTPEFRVPVTPWPPPDLREELIQLVLNDPETIQLLEGHRYRVFDVHRIYGSKTGPCATKTVSCVYVGLYDYTVPTGLKIIVDLATREVLDRRILGEYQPGPSQEELVEIADIIANTPDLGPDVKLDRAAGTFQVSDTDLGGQCGIASPLHRCLKVKVTQSTGASLWVVVDMVERKVVRVH